MSKYDSHPIFQAYRTDRKAVKAEIKVRGVKFIDLPAEVRDPYTDALSAFIKLKAEHQRSKTDCQSKTETPATKADCLSKTESPFTKTFTKTERRPTSCIMM